MLPTCRSSIAAYRLLSLSYCLDYTLNDILLYFDMAICRTASCHYQEEKEEEEDMWQGYIVHLLIVSEITRSHNAVKG